MLNNEKELLEEITCGDMTAFSTLMKHYSQGVYTLVVRIIGNECEAEEVTQDIFMKVYNQLSYFSGRSTFSTWLYRIAYNAALSSKRVRRGVFAEISERALAQVGEEVEEQLFIDADIALLESALLQLHPRHRAVVELHYRHSLSLAEVAEVVGTNENNVKVMIHRARRQLALLITNSRNDGE